MEQAASDVQLLERLKDSDEEAFRDLFDRYQPMVFRQVYFQTRQADLSHDIVQETFIRIWEHRAGLKPQLSFLAYALRISGNLVRDAARHRAVRERATPTTSTSPCSESDDPVEVVQAAMLQERLTAIVSKLPEKCRRTFFLSRFEGKTNGEIAQLLGLSVRTVEHQINHALKVLRKKLAR